MKTSKALKVTNHSITLRLKNDITISKIRERAVDLPPPIWLNVHGAIEIVSVHGAIVHRAKESWGNRIIYLYIPTVNLNTIYIQFTVALCEIISFVCLCSSANPVNLSARYSIYTYIQIRF